MSERHCIPHGECLDVTRSDASGYRGAQADNESVRCVECDDERKRSDGIWII